MSRSPSPSSSSVDGDTSAAAVPLRTGSTILALSGWPSSISFVAKVDWYSHTTQVPGSGIQECTFAAGDYHWCVKIYPYGKRSSEAGWVSVYRQLEDDIDYLDGRTVMAQLSISLLDQDGQPVPSCIKNSRKIRAYASKDKWGYGRFIARHVLQSYLRGDCFRLKFEVVVHQICGKPAVAPKTVIVSPSDLQRHLLDLLRSRRGGDVTFEVGGEIFAAHRCMLAARSSVFMAELFGPMAESATAPVQVEDMEPRVFEAMLEFIYTDSWPEVIDPGEVAEMAQHLLVAADRYNLERLKLTCEEILCDNIDRHTAATILTLAEQHGCPGLKQACFNFLRWIPGNLNAVMASDGRSLVKDIADQAAAMSGSHVLKIERYSRTKRLGNGSCVMSIMFAVGGCHWCIEYYPDGHSSEDAGWISVFLVLRLADGANGGTVRARYQISLLDLDGNPVPSCRIASGRTPSEFSVKQGEGGELVERKVLEGSAHLKNDAFTVRCDITIAE